MPRWLRILAGVAITIAVFLVLAGLFGYGTVTILETRHMAKQFPVIDKTPAPLTDLSVSPSAGRTFSLPGYTFALPWTEIDEAKSKVFKARLFIALPSGHAVIASSVPPMDFINGIQSNFRSTRENMGRAFGSQAVKSDYDFKRLILYTTRNHITLTTSWRRCTRINLLLVIKGIMVPGPDVDLYAIETKEMKGFQLGDPARRPRKMAIELYDDEGEIELIFGQWDSGPVPPITQPELNFVIRSIRKTSGGVASLAK
jgi:hypothetical protein